MEIVTPRKYSALAAEKIASELKSFQGNQYGNAVKTFVASTLTNFCEQNEQFAEVVYLTPATLSDCCEKIMKDCGKSISDIDVYRGAVKFYFPNSEIEFKMNIQLLGDAPTEAEMERPKPRKEPKVSKKPEVDTEDDSDEAEEAEQAEKKPKKPKNEKKPIPAPKKETPEKAAAPANEKKPKSKKDEPADSLIQLSLF